MIFWPVKEVYILADVGIGILKVVYMALIVVTSKLVEELLQTMVVVSQLCVVWVVSQYGALATTVVVMVAGVHMVGLMWPMTGEGVVVWVVSQYGTLVVTVVILQVIAGAHLAGQLHVIAGAHVVGLTLTQLVLVQVNLALWWSCSICTSGSKLVPQCIIPAVQPPMIMFVHVNVTLQLGLPTSGFCLKCTLARLHYTHKDYTYCDRWQWLQATPPLPAAAVDRLENSSFHAQYLATKLVQSTCVLCYL